MQNTKYILEAIKITKSFSGIHVLNRVNLKVKPGEVHALVGENGAGKSTLMKIIMGIVKEDAGEVRFAGEKVVINNPVDALKIGISMIHQELTPLPNMTVYENLFIGKEIMHPNTPFVNKKKMQDETKEVLALYGLNVSPVAKVSSLSVAQIQMLEIIKAVRENSKLIIMDEPTSSLSDEESKNLFEIIHQLIAKNVAVIYISHRLEEVLALADAVTVLRDGEYIDTRSTKNVTRENMIEMMVGRSLDNIFPKNEVLIGDTIFKVEKLNRAGVFKDISFEVHKGEILGISGLMGAGRSEVARAIFGLDKLDSGEIFLNQKLLKISNPIQAIAAGIGMVSEDRKRLGLVLSSSIKNNITLPSLKKFASALGLKKKAEQTEAVKMAKMLGVKYGSIDNRADSLSGGNQQKVVLAKWLMNEPTVLILDEPTRGIDVGAKAEIHKLMSELAGKGLAIIMISSEMSEIMGMSDRVLVMSNGEISGEFHREDILKGNITQNELLKKALNN